MRHKTHQSEPRAEENAAPQAQDQPNLGAEAKPPSESAPPPEPSREDQLKEQTLKAADNWDRFLRLSADFENYKKRILKEKAEFAKYASSALLQNLLTVLDNFEMALTASAQATDENAQSLKTGITMILSQLKGVLQEAGLREIDAIGGARFDPNLHEAVTQQESDAVPEGHVLQQLRKGYQLHDRLLRPASVIVAKGPSVAQNSLAASHADSNGNA